jgi:hypothetical protein
MDPWGYVSIALVFVLVLVIGLEYYFKCNKLESEVKILKIDLEHAKMRYRHEHNDNVWLRKRMQTWRVAEHGEEPEGMSVRGLSNDIGKCKDLWD